MSTIAVYLLASEYNGTLYVGVTSDVQKRIWQHKNDAFEGFTKKYNVKKLVWYETHVEILSAIQREKHIKKWNREWKIRLIEQENPQWDDLYISL
jgi:putative endonuclease